MEENQGFIDQNKFIAPNIPGTGAPAAFQQNTSEINIDHLNAMINNPNEHADVVANAKALKERLFPDVNIDTNEEEVMEEPKPKSKPRKKKKTTKKAVKKVVENLPTVGKIKTSRNVDGAEFDDFLNHLSSELYTDEVTLLDGETVVQLKSMTVEEYKFLTKQLELFESRNSMLDKSLDSYEYDVQQLEFALTSSLDVILKRCITNQYPVENLTLYDWVYLLVYLRLISRGEEAKFKITSRTKDKSTPKVSYIDINISEMLDWIKDRREQFMKNPMSYINVDDTLGLYLMIPTRGDMIYIQNYCKSDPEASANILTLAMCVKAYVRDGVANIMSADQRVKLLSCLSYDHLQEITSAYKENSEVFFEVVNDYVRTYNKDAEGFNLSDFILFFYDF